MQSCTYGIKMTSLSRWKIALQYLYGALSTEVVTIITTTASSSSSITTLKSCRREVIIDNSNVYQEKNFCEIQQPDVNFLASNSISESSTLLYPRTYCGDLI